METGTGVLLFSLRPTFLGRRSIFIPNAEKLFFPPLLFPGNLEALAATAARALGKTAADQDKNNYGAHAFHRYFSTFSASSNKLLHFHLTAGRLDNLAETNSVAEMHLEGFAVLKFNLVLAPRRNVMFGLEQARAHSSPGVHI